MKYCSSDRDKTSVLSHTLEKKIDGALYFEKSLFLTLISLVKYTSYMSYVKMTRYLVNIKIKMQILLERCKHFVIRLNIIATNLIMHRLVLQRLVNVLPSSQNYNKEKLKIFEIDDENIVCSNILYTHIVRV